MGGPTPKESSIIWTYIPSLWTQQPINAHTGCPSQLQAASLWVLPHVIWSFNWQLNFNLFSDSLSPFVFSQQLNNWTSRCPPAFSVASSRVREGGIKVVEWVESIQGVAEGRVCWGCSSALLSNSWSSCELTWSLTRWYPLFQAIWERQDSRFPWYWSPQQGPRCMFSTAHSWAPWQDIACNSQAPRC